MALKFIQKRILDTTLKLSGILYVIGNTYMKEIYGVGMLLSKRCASDDVSVSLMASRMKRKA
ncbi:hypothetical protein AXF42_Ash000050 [Apostasia shenzhenica]|uniref:Uncharacterized protein n=1 Tax=Apostasia shenzhenica TaxID=1088818 RepID=A0A2I0AFA3_9ASPA|nr:hypothetical protein AXF42_Ash000050 [Apostasia shenzhenica]